jgi:hypothetical protein
MILGLSSKPVLELRQRKRKRHMLSMMMDTITSIGATFLDIHALLDGKLSRGRQARKRESSN